MYSQNSSGPSRNMSKVCSMNDFTFLYSSEKQRSSLAVIVYQNANPNSTESEIMQLYAKAKCVIPAVRNYLYFHLSQVAVVYFGKRLDKDGTKFGIREGAEDFKIKMIRFLTSEVWPPLLRTDAPDESLGTDILEQHGFGGDSDDTADPVSPATRRCRQEAEEKQEKEWLRKCLESSMEVLVYLKQATNNTKYLKIILHNNTQRIHFDVIKINDEKSRWERRMLFTRIMDNLESQKAIESYESYCSYFRQACEMAAHHSMELERPTQPPVRTTIYSLPVAIHSTPTCATPESPSPTSWFGFLDPIPNSHRGGQGSPVPLARVDSTAADGVRGSGVHTPQLSTPPSCLSLGSAAQLHVAFSPSRTPAVVPPRGNVQFISSFDRYYDWMSNLEKPESATLDYKSYMSNPADEIIHRSVKFMCGFLNAYGSGKLVIGVHEFARRFSCSANNSGTTPTPRSAKTQGRNTIVQHNDLVDQYVVGVRMTEKELEEVQRDVSEQLLNCVPPIPPVAMQIDLVPIRFPENIAISPRVLVLYDLHPALFSTQDAIKQKCNSAIRYLNPLGLSVIPMPLTEKLLHVIHHEIEEDLNDYPNIVVEAFHVASISDPTKVESKEWETVLLNALSGSGKRCSFIVVDSPVGPNTVIDPPAVHVVEVSIDLKQCGYAPLLNYKGKFFTGWPSIPLWDPTTERVREYPRNYRMWNVPTTDYCTSNTSPTFSNSDSSSCINRYHSLPVVLDTASGSPVSKGDTAAEQAPSASQRKPRRPEFRWYKNRQVARRVLEFLYNLHGVEDILHFRLLHPLCNAVFEDFQGTQTIKMISRTPVGTPDTSLGWKQISRFQHSLQLSGLPPMPLLLCRVYELMGNLPSPYPYVSVPLQQQSFRLSKDLIPLYYSQSYFDGTMRMAVVLDLRDSFVKMVHLRCGMLYLDTIGGVGFEQMSNYKAIIPMCGARSAAEEARNCSQLRSSCELLIRPHHTTGPEVSRKRILVNNEQWRGTSMMLPRSSIEAYQQAKREVELDLPLLSFTFQGMNELMWSDETKLESSFSTIATFRREQPWTLFTLINWIRTVLMDSKHTINFGYCDRSFIFRFLRVEDVCSSHFASSVATRLGADGVTLASKEDCLLHRRQAKWLELA